MEKNIDVIQAEIKKLKKAKGKLLLKTRLIFGLSLGMVLSAPAISYLLNKGGSMGIVDGEEVTINIDYTRKYAIVTEVFNSKGENFFIEKAYFKSEEINDNLFETLLLVYEPWQTKDTGMRYFRKITIYNFDIKNVEEVKKILNDQSLFENNQYISERSYYENLADTLTDEELAIKDLYFEIYLSNIDKNDYKLVEETSEENEKDIIDWGIGSAATAGGVLLLEVVLVNLLKKNKTIKKALDKKQAKIELKAVKKEIRENKVLIKQLKKS